jgi:sugar phosphate isomerase/epimerase
VNQIALNMGFAANRFAHHKEWINVVINELNVNNVQLTADLINPMYPKRFISEITNEINQFQNKGLNITSIFTGNYTRLNHLSSPYPEIQLYWIDWFKKLIDIATNLNVKVIGSHLGIQTLPIYRDKKLSLEYLDKTIYNWMQVSEYASQNGIKMITWEPMSIGREYGETIENADLINQKLNENSSIPFFLCYDVDHGDRISENPGDTNPISWINHFSTKIKQIHLKQGSQDKLSNMSFTNINNERGRINLEEIINEIEVLKLNDIELILELNFRERNPIDTDLINEIQESISFLRKVQTL